MQRKFFPVKWRFTLQFLQKQTSSIFIVVKNISCSHVKIQFIYSLLQRKWNEISFDKCRFPFSNKFRHQFTFSWWKQIDLVRREVRQSRENSDNQDSTLSSRYGVCWSSRCDEAQLNFLLEQSYWTVVKIFDCKMSRWVFEDGNGEHKNSKKFKSQNSSLRALRSDA